MNMSFNHNTPRRLVGSIVNGATADFLPRRENLLILFKAQIDRLMRIFCKKDKNNVTYSINLRLSILRLISSFSP